MAKEKLDKLKKELEDVEVVIVDEMSMVSADDFYNLHVRLQQIFDSKDDFGGRGLMMFGDLLQLPPVQARAIFKKPKSNKSSVWRSMKDKNLKPIGDLWLNCEVVYLKTNFRQGEGNPWTNLLNRVRIGEPSLEDLETLESRKHTLLSKESYDKATHVFYTNREVFKHNDYMINTLSTKLVQIPAKCEVPTGSGYIPHVNDWGLIDQTNFSMNLELKVGARIMLISNVCIPDSLVNGALGTIIDITFTESKDVEAIIVEFDNPEAGLEQKKDYAELLKNYPGRNVCPIFRSTMEYQIGYKKSKQKSWSHS